MLRLSWHDRIEWILAGGDDGRLGANGAEGRGLDGATLELPSLADRGFNNLECPTAGSDHVRCPCEEVGVISPREHLAVVEDAGRLRDALGVATSVGYGPRYLHSTGQYHKGGPAIGGFLLISCGSKSKLRIPGQDYGFETLIRAQALGDLEALESRKLPVIHADLTGAGAAAGLSALLKWVSAAARQLRRRHG